MSRCWIVFATLLASAQTVVLKLDHSPYAKLHNVPVSSVTITQGFWSARRQVNVEKSIDRKSTR